MQNKIHHLDMYYITFRRYYDNIKIFVVKSMKVFDFSIDNEFSGGISICL